jgi:hypothetical protein
MKERLFYETLLHLICGAVVVFAIGNLITYLSSLLPLTLISILLDSLIFACLLLPLSIAYFCYVKDLHTKYFGGGE